MEYNTTEFPSQDDDDCYPPYVRSSECTSCEHARRMGYPIPLEEITIEIAEGCCPNCRNAFPFEALNCPVAPDGLEEIWDGLSHILTERSCNGDFRGTISICKEMMVPWELLLPWLRGHGATCDCEIVANLRRLF